MDLGPRRRKGFVFWFSVQVCRGSALLVAAALLAIMSPRLQPHLDDDVEKLVGVVWFSRTSSGDGGLRIVMELHRWFIFLLRLQDGCSLHDPFGNFPSASKNTRTALGRAAVVACRRHGLEVEHEGHLEDLVVIFVSLEVFCIVRCFY